MGFEVSDSQARSSVAFSLSYLVCLHAAKLPAVMTMVETTEPISQPQVNVVLIKVALVVVSVHSSRTLTNTILLIVIDQFDYTFQ